MLLIQCFTFTATAASATKTLAYVTSYGENSLSIIDTSTNTIVKTIPVGNKPIGVAVSPDGKEVYVVNSDSNSVSIIDTYTGEKKGDIGVGQQPQQVAFAPDGKHAYVTSLQGGSLSVIDTATRGVTTIWNNTLSNGRYIAVSPDGNKAYVSTMSGNVISVSLPDKKVLGWVSYNGANANVPGGIALNPDGSRAYVVLAAHFTIPGDVSVVDTASMKELNNFSTGADKEKWGIKYNPGQSLLYIANTQNNQVIVSNILSPAPGIRKIGLATTIVTPKPSPTPVPTSTLTTIATGTDPWDLDFTPDSGTLYVACRDSVTVINAASRIATTSIMLQGMHYGIDVATVSVFVPDPSPSPSPSPGTAQAVNTPTVTASAPTSVTPTATDNISAPLTNETNATQASSPSITPMPASSDTNTTLYLVIGGLVLVIVALLLAVVALGGYRMGKKK